ncbi:replication initiator [Phytohabitans houttuyneae]|uniref:Replication initiation protein n=1 Tax=Phytohabitans houttuyneae TaxID=1076126 RepID=A0A6V8KTI8_9ACTN|nr:replication initiator [Phytohabitans houttuyneae]GFJ85127.1 replication initiation protein [Phytohabitans houttuyneae]
MTVSTLSAVPEATASGTAPYAEPDLALRLDWLSRSTDVGRQAVARAARPDFEAWLSHVRPASACMRPIRLAGTSLTVDAATGRVLVTVDTAGMPDGVIYKPCGNRRETVCPACSKRYQRDAYHVVRTGLVGGRGVPEDVAQHPAVFPTFTAPSFGQVHTRVVRRHTCARRRDCDCRAEPCHARRDLTVCPHGTRLLCFVRHDNDDARLGSPLCLDCYDHDAQVVWNLQAGELWRRTTIAINRQLRRLVATRGIPHVPTVSVNGRVRTVPPVRLSFGKAAEMQRRGVVHFHAIVRLDGIDPTDPTAVVPPPAGIDADDLKAIIDRVARTVGFTTEPHPAQPAGWQIGWGDQVLTKVITVAGRGEVTDAQVASYLAKYATKSTEVTGATAPRLTDGTVNLYADGDGTHTERLIEACWQLGQPREWRRLRRWAHMLGFGGHFLTKSRRYSITFALLRNTRVAFRRTQTSGPEQTTPAEQPTTLVVNFLQFVGAGWHTTADALLANTSAAMAREHQQTACEYLATIAA